MLFTPGRGMHAWIQGRYGAAAMPAGLAIRRLALQQNGAAAA
ncbi:hypothetical protein ASZ90_009576 [hydrocarbon metagenome]|uniref:Uncharacterized protein n=1 Tax=hydrocarbon metagenome TaxID=938273 RepID=A0A0W8FJ08_9ZZZZ